MYDADKVTLDPQAPSGAFAPTVLKRASRVFQNPSRRLAGTRLSCSREEWRRRRQGKKA
jgi:hypothetical protein